MIDFRVKDWAMALVTSLLCTPLMFNSALAQDTEQTDLDGVWRGVLHIQEHVQLVLGITIENGRLTLDSPNQGMFDREPTEFTVTSDGVEFVDTGLSAQFSGEFDNNALVGTFTQGPQRPLTLYRLSNEDLQRMKFEGLYAGDLVINRRSTLPLRLNIAVLHADSEHGEYMATLDSPAQQSYGIPIESIEVSEQHLSFTSSLINASFESEKTEEGYAGTFTQGQQRSLTLKKVEEGEELAEVPKPEPGQHGGALAVLTRDDHGDYAISTEFYQSHDAQTQYEIGSVTKTMVGYLLAALAEDGTVHEDTAVKAFFQEADASVTLTDLATHHSGLPRLPAALFEGADPQDPYAHFDYNKLREALVQTELGEKNHLYSNYGYGLLGEALAQAAETDFAGLMQSQLFEPAEMADSYVSLSGQEEHERLAQGHDSLGDPAAPWHFQALAGAGAVVSTLDDMVKYARFMLDGANTQDPVILRMLESRHTMSACCQQALGWIIQEDEQGRPMAWHAGQTAGFSAYVGFYLDGSAALVFLNNQSVDHSATMQRKLWASVP